MLTVYMYNRLTKGNNSQLHRFLRFHECEAKFIDKQTTSFSEQKKVVVIHDFFRLKISLIKFVDFIIFFEENEIEVVIENLPCGLKTQDFLTLMKNLSEKEKNLAREKTKAGLENARLMGKTLGRPAVPNEKVDEIREMYNQKKTLREIAYSCEVSLGTVHKYTR